MIGVFHPDCRVELVNGEIFEMSPIDPRHAGIVDWLADRFFAGLGGRAIVRVQNPTTVDRRSEPQPDLMPLARREDFYRTAHRRGPSPDGYRDQCRRRRGESVEPSAFPDLRLSVDDLLGPPPRL